MGDSSAINFLKSTTTDSLTPLSNFIVKQLRQYPRPYAPPPTSKLVLSSEDSPDRDGVSAKTRCWRRVTRLSAALLRKSRTIYEYVEGWEATVTRYITRTSLDGLPPSRGSHPVGKMNLRLSVLLTALSLLVSGGLGIGQQSCVSFQSSSSSFAVVSGRKAAPVLVSSEDWPGVQRAAFDFVDDIQRVTGLKPILRNITDTTAQASGYLPIIIGTLGKSPLIDQVVNATNLDVSSIEGQWEAFLSRVVEDPLPGVAKAYVIIGADKRGTIYALYDHSEQFGVSPWY